MDDCPFCGIVGATPESRAEHDTVLIETPHFAVVPALGSLVVGHVMVVTKQHISSLSRLEESELAEYTALVDRIAQVVGETEPLLQAEHGSLAGVGGGCIEHAHVNIVPGQASASELFSDYPESQTIDSAAQLRAVQPPYIFLSGFTVRVLPAAGVPSQLIRRRIWNSIGRSDWDYTLFPNHDLIQLTLDAFGGDPAV